MVPHQFLNEMSRSTARSTTGTLTVDCPQVMASFKKSIELHPQSFINVRFEDNVCASSCRSDSTRTGTHPDPTDPTGAQARAHDHDSRTHYVLVKHKRKNYTHSDAFTNLHVSFEMILTLVFNDCNAIRRSFVQRSLATGHA